MNSARRVLTCVEVGGGDWFLGREYREVVSQVIIRLLGGSNI